MRLQREAWGGGSLPCCRCSRHCHPVRVQLMLLQVYPYPYPQQHPREEGPLSLLGPLG